VWDAEDVDADAGMIAGRVEDDVIVPVSGALPASEQVRGDETAEVVGQ